MLIEKNGTKVLNFIETSKSHIFSMTCVDLTEHIIYYICAKIAPWQYK